MVIVMTAVAHEVRGDAGAEAIRLLGYWTIRLLQLNRSACGEPLE